MKKYLSVAAIASLLFLSGCEDGLNSEYSEKNLNGTAVDLAQYPLSELNNDHKYMLAYMWNEEKLAKDVYLKLYESYPDAKQLYNIPTKSEVKHQHAVEDLVQRYDINISNLADYSIAYSQADLRALAPGKFAISELQELYDELILKGTVSEQDALEVGCMVEVVDVNDLNHDIELAGDAQDIVATFEYLREGSYKHYWAFDKGLKNHGVTEGCCSLGTAWCHLEYPQNEKGGGH